MIGAGPFPYLDVDPMLAIAKHAVDLTADNFESGWAAVLTHPACTAHVVSYSPGAITILESLWSAAKRAFDTKAAIAAPISWAMMKAGT